MWLLENVNLCMWLALDSTDETVLAHTPHSAPGYLACTTRAWGVWKGAACPFGPGTNYRYSSAPPDGAGATDSRGILSGADGRRPEPS